MCNCVAYNRFYKLRFLHLCNCRSDTDHYVRSYSLTQLHADFDDCHWVSSDSDDEDGTVESDVISKQLSAWVVKYSVSQCAVSALLGILKPHIACLPSHAHTLMNTPRSCGIKSLKLVVNIAILGF